MQRILVRELGDNLNNEVIIKGYIHQIKSFRNFRFISVRDRTGICQVVLPNDSFSDSVNLEDIVELKGKILQQPKSPFGNLELIASDINFLSRGKKGHLLNERSHKKLSIEKILDKRALTIRFEKSRKIFELQSSIIGFLSSYLRKNEFIEVKTPRIISSLNEGGSELFEINYFGRKAHLSQSPQLYHQILLGTFERIFEINTLYRAQNYTTIRHLNEFTGLDAHISFIESSNELITFVEKMFLELISFVTNKGFVNYEKPNIDKEIIKLSYQDAIQVIKRKFGDKLTGNDKRIIGETVKKEYKSNIVFLYNFPANTNNFYILEKNFNGERIANDFKLIYKGQEICSGAQLIHDYDSLISKMRDYNINLKNFEDYLEAFRCGIPPHGGFCFGLERLTAGILDIKNVKEASLFPRDSGRISP